MRSETNYRRVLRGAQQLCEFTRLITRLEVAGLSQKCEFPAVVGRCLRSQIGPFWFILALGLVLGFTRQDCRSVVCPGLSQSCPEVCFGSSVGKCLQMLEWDFTRIGPGSGINWQSVGVLFSIPLGLVPAVDWVWFKYRFDCPRKVANLSRARKLCRRPPTGDSSFGN